MESEAASELLLKEFLDGFDAREEPYSRLTNLKYLEFHLSRLERTLLKWEASSIDPALGLKERARARDLTQNARGLINGIKFGISFIIHQTEDLDKSVEDLLGKNTAQHAQ